jgi:beta-mannosidase
MYDVTVTVTDGDDGHILCQKTVKHGFRKVELVASPTTYDGDGRFAFKVNDVEIYCQGTNWVPMSPYHSMDADRYKAALDLIDDCGCNIIRCWGGNVYEDTYFYDYCDRHGIMVWQDFTMACNFYPQEDWFYEKMRKEAKSVVKKFRNHPSLVLWAGDN